MQINIAQWVDVDADFCVQEVYDAMNLDEIEEMIEVLQENGHLQSLVKNEEYERTFSDVEWETMLTSLISRNARLLITEEEYNQVKAIYNRLGI